MNVSDKLIQEGRIQSKKVKGETIYIRTYETSHRMNRTEIIDDWGWNINELPPVPTVENAKQYWCSGFWEEPYTDTNIRKHILTALKDTPSISVDEICKNDNFFHISVDGQ